MPDAQNVESSATAVETQESPAIETWTSEQRSEWLKTGNPPEAATVAPKTKESSAPAPATAEAGETEPASEPGLVQEPKPAPAKPGAPGERRKSQLAGEIQQLLKARAELRQETERLLAEKAGKTAGAPSEPMAGGKAPDIADFATTEEYAAAWEKFAEARSQAAVEADRRARAAEMSRAAGEKRNQEIDVNWRKRAAAFQKSNPEIADFQPAVQALADSEMIPQHGPLEGWILNSEQGPALAYHFAQFPDEVLRIGELGWIEMSRELTKLELSLEEKAKVPVPTKTKQLPRPPTEVGAKAAAPEDEVEAAVARGDFTAFRRLENARELAARRT